MSKLYDKYEKLKSEDLECIYLFLFYNLYCNKSYNFFRLEKYILSHNNIGDIYGYIKCYI